MQVKYLAGIVGAALLLAGCSSSNELTSAGQNVRFVEDKPGSECQLLGHRDRYAEQLAVRAEW
jgi:outer membrane murein-binding lipoprotein Lpp